MSGNKFTSLTKGFVTYTREKYSDNTIGPKRGSTTRRGFGMGLISCDPDRTQSATRQIGFSTYHKVPAKAPRKPGSRKTILRQNEKTYAMANMINDSVAARKD